MAEEQSGEQATESPPTRRRRRTATESETTDSTATEPAGNGNGHPVAPETTPILLENGQVLRWNEDGSPLFSPMVKDISAKAHRTVRTGQYTMYEISDLMTAAPDPRFSSAFNLDQFNLKVTDAVNKMAAIIEASLEVDKPKEGI